MFVGMVYGGHFLETGYNIILDRWISSFVQSQAGGCVRIEEITDSFIDICPDDFLFYLLGNINELHGAGSANRDFSL